MKLQSVLVLVSVILAVLLNTACESTKPKTFTIEIQNNTEHTIKSVFIKKADSNDWGNNILKKTINNGDKGNINLPEWGIYDIMLRTGESQAEGIGFIKFNLDITNMMTLNFDVNDRISIRIVNHTGVSVAGCWIRATGSSDWGANIFNYDLDNGVSRELNISLPGQIDVMIRNSTNIQSGLGFIKLNINIDEESTVIIMSNDSEVPYFVIQNNTGHNILSAWIRNPYTTDWGNNLFGSELSSGASRIVTIPQYGLHEVMIRTATSNSEGFGFVINNEILKSGKIISFTIKECVTPHFNLYNTTGDDIVGLWIKSPISTEWGSNLLNSALANNTQITFMQLQEGFYDIMVRTDNTTTGGIGYLVQNMKLAIGTTVTFVIADRIDFTIQNKTGRDIRYIWIRSAGSNDWENEGMGISLTNDSSTEVTIPMYGNYDILLRTAYHLNNGFGYMMLNVRISEGSFLEFTNVQRLPFFNIKNNTGFNIAGCWIRQVGTESWGINLFDTYSHNNIEVEISQDETLDIMLSTASTITDGRAFVKTNQLVSNGTTISFTYSDRIPDFKLLNNTGDEIKGVWVKKSYLWEYGSNYISSTIAIGASVDIYLSSEFYSLSYYDILISSESTFSFSTINLDNSIYTKLGYRIITGATINFTSSDLANDHLPRITIQNDTGISIEGVWVQYSGWLWENRLNTVSLDSGQALRLTLPYSIYPTTTVDIMLRTSTNYKEGDVYAKLNHYPTNNSIISILGSDLKTVITGPAGGYVFYDKGEYSDGWRYLEAAPDDEGYAQWGLFYVYLPTSVTIGSGKSNTDLIVSNLNYYGETQRAAQLCANKTLNGFSDWFLPSRDEMILMDNNLHRIGFGGFQDDWYWTSTDGREGYDLGPWVYDFYGSNVFQWHKAANLKVRAIRAY